VVLAVPRRCQIATLPRTRFGQKRRDFGVFWFQMIKSVAILGVFWFQMIGW
jgi:hypothetical protein